MRQRIIFDLHQEDNHPTDGPRGSIVEEPRTAKCDHCGFKSETKSELETHIATYHMVDYSVQQPINLQNYYAVEQLHLELHNHAGPIVHCTFCDSNFSSMRSLNVHTAKNHPEKLPPQKKSWQSPGEEGNTNCGPSILTSQNETILEDHIAGNHSQPISSICSLCSKPFPTETDLAGHMWTTHGLPHKNFAQIVHNFPVFLEQSFPPCDVCNRSSENKTESYQKK